MRFLRLPRSAAVLAAWCVACLASDAARAATPAPAIQLGAYYFDGWSGRNKADGDPKQPWARGAPTHLTRPLATEFADREPLWGWRSDTPEIMRRQIDLAADGGLSFWAFCWYFQPKPEAVAADPKHTGLRLFLEAPNRDRLRFCLLVANHDSYQLRTLERWRQAAAHWLPYLRHPRAVTVGGKPLIILFDPKDALPEGMAAVDAAAREAGLPGVAWAGCGVNLPAPFALTTRYNATGGWMKGWHEFPFTQVMENHRLTWKGEPAQRHIPCAIVGWDRRPWETAERGSHYYTGRTPALFGRHVRDLLAWMRAHPDEITAERLALLYAWNENGEGGYLMPTKGDPAGAYLREVKAAVAEDAAANTKAPNRSPATPTEEEIAAQLAPAPVVFGPAVAEREAWKRFAGESAGASLVRQAAALLRAPMPEGTDEVYAALHKDYSPANRASWDKLSKARRDRVRVLTLAECLENRGRFLPELERTIASLCAEKSWVFPNYDRDLASYRQTVIQIDLFSSALAWNLATADGLLGDRLGADTRRLLRAELERRIFTPFRRMAAGQQPPYWFNYRNNWQAVCLAGVTGAALAVLESPAERAFFVRQAMERSWVFLESYTPDGYCSEGVGYWNYGFGHYVLLAGIIHQATGGRLDLLARPPVRAAAAYGHRIEIAPGISPAFADADPVVHPEEQLMNFLNRRFGFGQAERPVTPQAARHLFADLFHRFQAPRMAAGSAEAFPLEVGLRSWFPDAGILLCRPDPGVGGRFAVALKGGHNAEQHNHNDLGSFVVLAGGRPVLTDPGQEIRSGRTFSSRRYESRLTNSYGHPVPVVAGELQQTGAKARAVVSRAEFTPGRDTYAMDIASAYAVPGLRGLTRTFVYERAGAGSLTVIDEVVLDEARPFATALVTLGAWERTGPTTLRVTEGGEAVSVEIDTGGMPFVVEGEQIEGPRKILPATTRIGIRLENPVRRATIRLLIRP